MAKIRTIQIYRGTEAQNNAYTGSVGELTMDTDNNEIRLHDGSTAGGHKIGVVVDNTPTSGSSNAVSSGGVYTALGGKANIDASNFDATGKAMIAKIGKPSATYTNLTYGNPSNDFHIAPANGYVYIAATPSSQQPVGVVVADSTQTTNSGVQNNHIYQVFGRVPTSNMGVLVPIQKNFTFKAADGGSAFSSVHYYRFIYAEGEI